MPIKNKTCKVCANTVRKHKGGISISDGILASSKVFIFAVTEYSQSATNCVTGGECWWGSSQHMDAEGSSQGILPAPPLEVLLWSLGLRAW